MHVIDCYTLSTPQINNGPFHILLMRSQSSTLVIMPQRLTETEIETEKHRERQRERERE